MCPYCNGDTFVSATTFRRSEGTLVDPTNPASKRINQTWVNECAGCGQWSLHRDADHTQVALVDPDDASSAEVT